MKLITRLIDTANPVALGLAVIALVAYGFSVTQVLPQWGELHVAAAGSLPEEAFGLRYDLHAFLMRLGPQERADYILLQLLDVPFFVAQGLILAWAMALGIKARGQRIGLQWALVLPLIAMEADLVENVGLIVATFTRDAQPHWLYILAATQVKFVATQVGIALGAFGSLVWVGHNLYTRNREQGQVRLF